MHRHWHRIEQVPFQYVHAIGDAVAFRILLRELDSGGIRIGRPEFRGRPLHREADRNRAAAGADVGDARRLVKRDQMQRGAHHALGRRSR